MSTLDKIHAQIDSLKRATETELRRFYVAKCTAVILDARLFVRNVGQFQDDRGNVFKAGITGQADVWGWLFRDDGTWPMPLEIELKNVRTKESDGQRAWKAYCDSNGVPHLKLRAKKGETPRQVVDRWIEETERWLIGLRRLAA
jgi:hypothetical protein